MSRHERCHIAADGELRAIRWKSERRQLYHLHRVDVVVCIAGDDVAQRYEIRYVTIGIHHALTGARVEAEAIHLIINLHGHEDEIILHVDADGVAKVLCR